MKLLALIIAPLFLAVVTIAAIVVGAKSDPDDPESPDEDTDIFKTDSL